MWCSPLTIKTSRHDFESDLPQGALMSERSSLDRKSFQKLLASAFAVQESGMDLRSLSCLIDLQQSITTAGCSVHRAMQLVANQAINVANAAGIGIALLKADELVYRAGSGTAAARIGRRITAVLSMWPPNEGRRREILRVENAQTDWRVEAAVCRQLGATSLLILPICQQQALIGVMEILFEKPHIFQDGEVRAYRLMVQFVEEAILHDAQLSAESSLAPAGARIPQPVESAASPVHGDRPNSSPTNERGLKSRICEDRTLWATMRRRLCSLRRIGVVHSITRILTEEWGNNLPLNEAVLILAISLPLVTWVAYNYSRDHLEDSNPTTQAEVLSKASPTHPRDRQRSAPGEMKHRKLPNSNFRVQVGRNEIDYIADDVTIRHFTTRSTTPRVQTIKQVNIGDDVTVRYFAYTPSAPREAEPQIPSMQSAQRWMHVNK